MSSSKKPKDVTVPPLSLCEPADDESKGCEPAGCDPFEDKPCVGCVVALKSGGPEMVVTAVTCCDRVQVVWFCEGEGELHEDEFPARCLEVVRCA